jgi:hypothetical protein
MVRPPPTQSASRRSQRSWMHPDTELSVCECLPDPGVSGLDEGGKLVDGGRRPPPPTDFLA